MLVSTEMMLLMPLDWISLTQNLPVAAREEQNVQLQLLKFLRKESAAS